MFLYLFKQHFDESRSAQETFLPHKLTNCFKSLSNPDLTAATDVAPLVNIDSSLYIFGAIPAQLSLKLSLLAANSSKFRLDAAHVFAECKI